MGCVPFVAIRSSRIACGFASLWNCTLIPLVGSSLLLAEPTGYTCIRSCSVCNSRDDVRDRGNREAQTVGAIVFDCHIAGDGICMPENCALASAKEAVSRITRTPMAQKECNRIVGVRIVTSSPEIEVGEFTHPRKESQEET